MLFINKNNPNGKDCSKFYKDLNNCIKNDLKNHNGQLEKNDYFDFTKCKEFESFKDDNYIGQISLKFNLLDLSYPYNKYYYFEKENNNIEIKLND